MKTTSSQAGRCARQETDNQVKIKLRKFCSVAPNEWLVLSINCMCSAHHDPSESLVPVSDISREKRGPCSETTGSATVQPQHLIPFSSAADRERPPRLSGWERQRLVHLYSLRCMKQMQVNSRKGLVHCLVWGCHFTDFSNNCKLWRSEYHCE